MHFQEGGYKLTLHRYALINAISGQIYDTFHTLQEAQKELTSRVSLGEPNYRCYIGHITGTINITVYLENSAKYRVEK